MRSVMIVVWLVAGAYGMPNLIAYNTTQVMDDSGGDGEESGHLIEFCMNAANINLHIIVLINFLLLYCGPLLLITVMYTRVSVVLWKSSCSLDTKDEPDNKKGLSQKSRQQSMNVSLTNESEASTSAATQTHATVRSMTSGQSSVSKGSGKESAIKKTVNEQGFVENGRTRSQQNNTSNSKHAESISLNGKEINKAVFTKAISVDTAPNRSKINNGIAGNDASQNQKSFINKRKTNRIFHPASRNALRARRKVIRLLIAIVVSFTACMLPHHVRLLYEMWAPLNYHPSFAQLLLPPISFLLFYFNSALNPFLYAFLSDNFRNSLKDLFGCGRKKGVWNRRNRTISQKSFQVSFHRSSSQRMQSSYE